MWKGNLEIKRELWDLSTNHNDCTLFARQFQQTGEKKGQLEKYEQCLDTKEYQGIIVFRLNSGTKVRSSNIVAFLVIYTEIFSDDMMSGNSK